MVTVHSGGSASGIGGGGAGGGAGDGGGSGGGGGGAAGVRTLCWRRHGAGYDWEGTERRCMVGTKAATTDAVVKARRRWWMSRWR
jgi:hypothetical protein